MQVLTDHVILHFFLFLHSSACLCKVANAALFFCFLNPQLRVWPWCLFVSVLNKTFLYIVCKIWHTHTSSASEDVNVSEVLQDVGGHFLSETLCFHVPASSSSQVSGDWLRVARLWLQPEPAGSLGESFLFPFKHALLLWRHQFSSSSLSLFFFLLKNADIQLQRDYNDFLVYVLCKM